MNRSSDLEDIRINEKKKKKKKKKLFKKPKENQTVFL